ncbi:META domain-containing protein [Pontibacter chitinilyticus]|uniref:META domain-containing protein n=1 Tax=Pontibacter chitinilyticus TaxID=2674989 RepID=UPI00321C2ACD
MSTPKFLLAIGVLMALLIASCTVKPKNLASEVYTFKDAYWMLMSVEGQSPQAPNNTKTAYIRFEENDNDVHGFTGCNKFSGKYEADPERSKLTMNSLSATEVACPNADTENKLMQVLQNVDSYRISDNILTLYVGNKAVATFMTGTERSIDNEVKDELH